MSKKWLTAGAGLGIGAVLLLTSGFSALASTSGYDEYKTAWKNTKAESSLTAKVGVTVTDNGAKKLQATADVKLDQALHAGSVAATFGDGQVGHSLQVFRQDGKVILKSSDEDVYRVMEQKAPKWQQEDGKAGPPKAVEHVFDALMGNLRELATVESAADGSEIASLHLSGSQIPAIANALGTLAASKAVDHSGWEHASEADGETPLFTMAHQKANMPKLTDKIKIEKIDLDAKITPDKVLEWQTADIRISGTDDAGKEHELALLLRIDFSEFNATTPERIDLTGKKTKEIQHDGPKRGWNQ